MKNRRLAIRRLGRSMAALLAMAGAVGAAHAQGDAFPSKPIRFVVPFPGIVENLGRAVGEHITSETSQPVVVEGKPGSNGIVGALFAAKAPADGYTVFFTTNTTQVGNPAIYAKLTYDPFKDFVPVSGVAKGALIYVGSNKLGASSIPEVIAIARQRPGELVFGWAGSSGRAAIEMLNIAAGLKMRNVPYKSAPQALNDLVGGTIDLMVYGAVSTGVTLGRSGKLKVLGVSTAERLDIAPDVPTVREQGMTDFEMTYWVAAYVPAGTPAAVVNRLNALINGALRTARLRDMVRTAGMIPLPTTPDGLGKFQTEELAKWRRIVNAAGMQETL